MSTDRQYEEKELSWLSFNERVLQEAMDKTVPLIERDHRPFYGSPLHIVSPPERIEAGWWDGQLVTRDYFVAEGKDHTCYWIFQERMGSREGDESRWYLHGLFG